jgi:hypothetical protein
MSEQIAWTVVCGVRGRSILWCAECAEGVYCGAGIGTMGMGDGDEILADRRSARPSVVGPGEGGCVGSFAEPLREGDQSPGLVE